MKNLTVNRFDKAAAEIFRVGSVRMIEAIALEVYKGRVGIDAYTVTLSTRDIHAPLKLRTDLLQEYK